MSLITSTYRQAPRLQFNGHLQTLVPGIFRKVPGINYQHSRLTLSDGDFLDLDWLRNGNKRVAILTHGLEGDSCMQYMLGMADIFQQND